jgi:hypothetical protein
MSSDAMAWTWAAKTSPNEKLVLLALAWHCHESDECYPSIGRIVDMSGLSERSVQRALQVLNANKLITTVATRGGHASNTYRLKVIHTPATQTPQGRQRDTPPPPHRHPRGDTQSPQGCQSDTLKSLEKVYEKSSSSLGGFSLTTLEAVEILLTMRRSQTAVIANPVSWEITVREGLTNDYAPAIEAWLSQNPIATARDAIIAATPYNAYDLPRDPSAAVDEVWG